MARQMHQMTSHHWVSHVQFTGWLTDAWREFLLSTVPLSKNNCSQPSRINLKKNVCLTGSLCSIGDDDTTPLVLVHLMCAWWGVGLRLDSTRSFNLMISNFTKSNCGNYTPPKKVHFWEILTIFGRSFLPSCNSVSAQSLMSTVVYLKFVHCKITFRQQAVMEYIYQWALTDISRSYQLLLMSLTLE